MQEKVFPYWGLKRKKESIADDISIAAKRKIFIYITGEKKAFKGIDCFEIIA